MLGCWPAPPAIIHKYLPRSAYLKPYGLLAPRLPLPILFNNNNNTQVGNGRWGPPCIPTNSPNYIFF